jgi:hypothetical protein
VPRLAGHIGESTKAIPGIAGEGHINELEVGAGARRDGMTVIRSDDDQVAGLQRQLLPIDQVHATACNDIHHLTEVMGMHLTTRMETATDQCGVIRSGWSKIPPEEPGHGHRFHA